MNYIRNLGEEGLKEQFFCLNVLPQKINLQKKYCEIRYG